MVPVGFSEANTTVEDLTEGSEIVMEVQQGQMRNGEICLVSCWKMTQAEYEEVMRTKRVWLIVYGEMHPSLEVTGLQPR